MIKNFKFLPILVVLILFIQCKREVLKINPEISNLSDFESNDGKISLNISGGKMPYTVQWSNNATDSLLTSLVAGEYYVTITDAKKHVCIDTLIVTQPQWPVCIDVEGNNYKTTIVGDQIWMVENLRVTKSALGDSIANMVYNDSVENAVKYGRLYTWHAAMADSVAAEAQGICPDGWHVPTETDWKQLTDNISNVDKEIPNIKAVLDLQYGGFYNNGFNNIDASVSFWTSTEAHDNALKVYFHKSLSKAFFYHEKKSNAISVRCVKHKKPV